MADDKRDGDTSQEKLVFSVLKMWEAEGSAGVSARALAAAAGLPVSSIYYHFGGLEQLLEQAQGEGLAAASRWCESQLDAIGGKVRGAGALGPLLASLIDDWCETRRNLAFAWRESQLMALRDSARRPAAARWNTLWQRFWLEICSRLDIADMAQGTAWVFEGTSGLHLLRWRRPVDRAALAELCDGWAGWIAGRLAGPSPWFDLARRDAADLIPPPAPDDGVAERIAAAAAETVARRGVAGLTHRAVAAQADVTLGVVSHKFRTSADLLHAAFEAIYRRMVPHSADEMAAVAALDRGEALALVDGGLPDRADLLGTDELLTAAARDPAFQAFAARLRYLRGRSSGRFFQALMGPARPLSAIDAAIFSAFAGARLRTYLCGDGPHEPGIPTGDFAPLLARLDRG